MSSLKQKAKELKNAEQGKAQFVRFVLNGCFSASVHYLVYYLLQLVIEVNVAYATGYMVSFLVNYYTTCYFTFRRQPTWSHFIGFSGSHAVNFGLHIVLFWICMQLGIHRLVAPVIVMGIAMLVQFTILRWIFKKR
ncbi:MAG: GtrA family protein [Prevotella sp.]|jgi:putative flippase GtrA|nr:GtrA family protein [Prevotella sp.]